MNRTRKTGLSGVLVEILGWTLVLIGFAALVLPGPGLLALFAGMALLSTRYEWAERRLEPVKQAALRTARDSVSAWPHILASILGVLLLAGLGVIWGLQPQVPAWWPIADSLWLPGGWATGGTLIGSAVIAGSMVVYSYLAFRD